MDYNDVIDTVGNEGEGGIVIKFPEGYFFYLKL